MTPRIAIVHIGKTGGTSLRGALQRHYAAEEVCPFQWEGQYPADLAELQKYRLFDSHFGFDLASRLDTKLVTILRNPFDRIVSLYHYWREVPDDKGGHGIAKRASFEEFVEASAHENHVKLNMVDAQTWQIAFGTSMKPRNSNGNMTPDELLQRAKDNLERFVAVGVTENMAGLARQLADMGVPVDLEKTRLNVTKTKASAISMALRGKIYPLVSVDMALYDHVLRRFVF